MLTWDAIPLYSRKVMTFTDTNLIEPSPSNESAETLSISDIPSSRSLFRLRLSAHPTEETESSSLPLMLTPTSVQMTDTPDEMKKRKEKNGYRNGTKYVNLETQLKFDPRFKGLLKTPSEFDGTAGDGKKNPVYGDSGSLAQEILNGYAAKRGLILPTPLSVEREHPKRVQALKEAGATEMFSRENGSARPNGLMDHLNFYGLLPTPNAVEATKYTNTYNPESQMGTSLSALAGSGMLPTPTARYEKNPSTPDGKRIARKVEKGYTIELNDLAAMGQLPTPSSRDWKGRTNPGVVKEGSGCKYGETLPDTIGRVCDPKTDGQAFRLSPLFTEEMMGFPFGWTTFPFLSPNGEPSPSKPTGTQ